MAPAGSGTFSSVPHCCGLAWAQLDDHRADGPTPLSSRGCHNGEVTRPSLDQELRYRIYSGLAQGARASEASSLATTLGVGVAKVREGLERLHAAHALFLDAETREIRMALPFSSIRTAYRVEAGGGPGTPTVPGIPSPSCGYLVSRGRVSSMREPQVAKAGSWPWPAGAWLRGMGSFRCRGQRGGGGMTSSSPEAASCSSGRQRRPVPGRKKPANSWRLP